MRLTIEEEEFRREVIRQRVLRLANNFSNAVEYNRNRRRIV